jgi:murein DD-endopeptidase MepM/ murein hydrolase activator NlpD
VINIPEAGATARPYPAQTAVSHKVKAGETLSEIALMYGVTVHSLAAANGISNPARIYIGMVLSIPSAQAGSNSVRYASVGEGVCSDVEITQTGTGYFIRPTSGYVVTQYFQVWHAGIDLATNEGTDVYAADGGTVVFSGWNTAGYGYLVVLDHGNGWRTYYAHLSEIDVLCRQWIPRGSILGKVGTTGNSTGPHLHFEILRFGISVNPAGYIRF